MASWSRFLCAAIALSFALPAAAQTYRQEQVERGLRSRRQIAIRVAKLPAPNQEEVRQLQEYFEKYHLPAMTQATPEGLQDLEKLRVDLFKQLIYPAKGKTQTYLSEKAKDFAKRAVNPRANYHPAVTYNALLVMGLIDKTYADGDGDGEPTPDDEANRYLCGIATQAASQGRFPNYMLAGALIGLERHSRFLASLPQKSQQQTMKALYEIVLQDQLAGDYAEGVRDWIYLKAAGGLANLKSVGPRGAFFKAIGKRMADESLETETRVDLAAMLKDLNPSKGQVDAAPTIEAFWKLVAPVAEAEIELAEKFEDLQLRGGRAREIGGGRDKSGRRFRLEEDGIVLIRGGLLQLLTGLRDGAETLAELGDGDAGSRLTTIADALGPAITATSDTDTIDLNVAEAVKQAMRTALGAAKGEVEPEIAF